MMRRMRVGLDGTPLIGARTGVGWYTYDLVDAMAAAAPDDEFLLWPISWRWANRVESPPHSNVQVVRKFAPARPLWKSWEWFSRPATERFVDCDVFHGTNFVGPPSRRVPLVVTVHDLGFIRYPETCDAAVLAMAKALPAVLDRSAAVIAVSEFTRGELEEWLPRVAGRVRVVHNGFHARGAALVATRTNDNAVPYALFTGTLNRRKNVDVLLDAVAILRSRGSRLRLVLAGGHHPSFDVDAAVASRDLDAGAVTITGYIGEDEMAALYAGASVFVFPSLYEGFGMPLLEAMAAHVPIVATNAAATAEIAGDAALLVDASADGGTWADAIQRMLDDSDLRANLTRAGDARVELFSWDRAARETLAVYREVA